MIQVPFLEFHVSHACNFSCDGCSHFSNYKHAELASPKDLRRQHALWNTRIFPERMILLGGEPLLNKKIYRILIDTRRAWPANRLFAISIPFIS